MNWEDAVDYVCKHQPQARPWIPFFRDGHVVSNVHFMTYDGSTTSVDTRPVDIRGRSVALFEFRALDTRKKCIEFGKQLAKDNAVLQYKRDKVLKLLVASPNTTFSYETSNGYWSSIISKLHAYTVFVDTGTDILEGKIKRRSKRNRETDDQAVRKVQGASTNSKALKSEDSAGDLDEFEDEFDDEFEDEEEPPLLPTNEAGYIVKRDDNEVFTDDDSDEEKAYDSTTEFVSMAPPTRPVAASWTTSTSMEATEPMIKGEDGIYTLSEERVPRRVITSKYFAIKKYVPSIPPPHVRYARHPLTSVKLEQYLRDHPLGDLYQNPYRKVAGAHTSKETKTKAQNCIKDVLRQWALTTADGLAYLKECDIKPSELSIDRIVPENADVCHGLNFLPNLYFMPIGDNAYFNNKTNGDIGEYKRQYVGAMAWKLATCMNKKFAEDMSSRWLLCNFETEMRAILRGDR